MTKIKPIYFMHQEGLTALERDAVLDGASELVELSKAKGIEITDFGVWRNSNYTEPPGHLKPYQSVDWYIQQGMEKSRDDRQLNADIIQLSLLREPWRYLDEGGKDHYDIFAVHLDMYSMDTNFVIGLAQQGIGTTISTHRFRELDSVVKYGCIKTETMHELGHAFGLIPNDRSKNVEESLGKHCTNKCVMRQGLRLPSDWIRISQDRLISGALCTDCQQNLQDYFNSG